MKSGCQSPCATCPWLKANHGKPNPPTYDRAAAEAAHPGFEFYDWYSVKNLTRLWNGIRKGEGMICHASDSQASTYGGKNARPGKARLCIGALILVRRQIAFLEKQGQFREYQKRAGRGAMSMMGVARWVNRIMFDGVVPTEVTNADVALPFKSPVNEPPR